MRWRMNCLLLVCCHLFLVSAQEAVIWEERTTESGTTERSPRTTRDHHRLTDDVRITPSTHPPLRLLGQLELTCESESNVTWYWRTQDGSLVDPVESTGHSATPIRVEVSEWRDDPYRGGRHGVRSRLIVPMLFRHMNVTTFLCESNQYYNEKDEYLVVLADDGYAATGPPPGHHSSTHRGRPEVLPTHLPSSHAVRIFSPVRALLVNDPLELTCIGFSESHEDVNVTWYWRVWNGYGYELVDPVARGNASIRVEVSEREYRYGGHRVYSKLSVPTLTRQMNMTDFVCQSDTNYERDEYKVVLRSYEPKRLNEACLSDYECPLDANCEQGLCTCERFFVDEDGERCAPRKLGLGEACIRNYECVTPNAVCDRLCVCGYDSVQTGPNECKKSHGGQYVGPTRAYLDGCNNSRQCRGWDVNAVCEDRLCKCDSGYAQSDHRCWKKVWLGDICTSDDQCDTIIPNSACRNSTNGAFRECICVDGYRPYGTNRCMSHRLAAEEHLLRVVFTAAVCTIAFVALALIFCAVKSARYFALHRKGRYSRDAIMGEQHLSISRRVPLKSKPELSPQTQLGLPYTPLTRVDKKPLAQRPTSSEPVVYEDRTVGVSESAPLFVRTTDSSVC